jgi:hypothetical protein
MFQPSKRPRRPMQRVESTLEFADLLGMNRFADPLSDSVYAIEGSLFRARRRMRILLLLSLPWLLAGLYVTVAATLIMIAQKRQREIQAQPPTETEDAAVASTVGVNGGLAADPEPVEPSLSLSVEAQ